MSAPRVTRRAVLAGGSTLGVTSLVLPAATAAASEETPPASQTTTFGTSGTYEVPVGVTSIIVTAEGTAGGMPVTSVNGVTLKNGTAGRGGQVVATLAVTPGETLNVVVGASTAGRPETTSDSAPYRGGSGGQGIGIRSGSTWLVVAGGGGGAGGGGLRWISGTPSTYSATTNTGGNGGDATGAASPSAAVAGVNTFPGGGAAGASAGSGGSGDFGPGSLDDGVVGQAATGSDLGNGGAGGESTNPGGSAGSGYAGGGGGGAANSNGSGSGGGGGSNHVDAGASSVTQGYSTRALADGPQLSIQTVV